MSDLLHVTSGNEPGRTVVRVAGEIDVSNSDELDAAVAEAVNGSPGELVLDLVEVSFIDSTGIRSLLQAADRCAERSIALRVRPSAAVQRLAELTGITDRLSLE